MEFFAWVFLNGPDDTVVTHFSLRLEGFPMIGGVAQSTRHVCVCVSLTLASFFALCRFLYFASTALVCTLLNLYFLL